MSCRVRLGAQGLGSEGVGGRAWEAGRVPAEAAGTVVGGTEGGRGRRGGGVSSLSPNAGVEPQDAHREPGEDFFPVLHWC